MNQQLNISYLSTTSEVARPDAKDVKTWQQEELESYQIK
jgi:hypothetical protein